MNKSVQSIDFYYTYPIVSAMRTQLNSTIPENYRIYNTDDINGYATPAVSYEFSSLPGNDHEIPLGMGRKKEFGRGEV
jgi:hypothetical protein